MSSDRPERVPATASSARTESGITTMRSDVPRTGVPVRRRSFRLSGRSPRHRRIAGRTLGAVAVAGTAVAVSVLTAASAGAVSPAGAIAPTTNPPVETASQPAGAPLVPQADAVAQAPVLTFAGYQWTVKNSTSPVGPGPNVFDATGPSVDASGLHLRIVRTKAGWECSEVILAQTLGYGTYTWTVHGPLSTLDPDVVLGLFTYDSSSNAPTNREIDFEASRFRSASSPTDAQYVVQPYTTPGNLQRITIPKGIGTTVTMTWLPGRVTFSGSTVRPNGKIVAMPTWANSSPSVPVSAAEQVHMNLWLSGGLPPTDGRPVSVTVTGFRFTPAA